jgi:uncharacterized membrane protein YfcA
METRVRSLLGAIIAVSAIGMMITKYITNGSIDSYVLPFILLSLSVIMFFNKPKRENKKIKVNKKKQNIILSVLSVALITGLITFFTTLF